MLTRAFFEDTYAAKRAAWAKNPRGELRVRVDTIDGSSYDILKIGTITEGWVSFVMKDSSEVFISYEAISKVHFEVL